MSDRTENKLKKGELPKGTVRCKDCGKPIHPNYEHSWDYDKQICVVRRIR